MWICLLKNKPFEARKLYYISGTTLMETEMKICKSWAPILGIEIRRDFDSLSSIPSILIITPFCINNKLLSLCLEKVIQS